MDTLSIDPGTDMRLRWQPTERQISLAVRLMSGRMAPAYVLVPLAMPGKHDGIWTVGQEVVEVAGFWPVYPNESDGTTAHHVARGAASAAARAVLGDRPGTVSYAIVHPDRTWSVFED